MTMPNRPIGGATHRGRLPAGDARARRNAAQEQADFPVPPGFTKNRQGQIGLSLDPTWLEVGKDNRLRVRPDKVREVADAAVQALGMTRAAAVANLDGAAVLADVIATVNALLEARRAAGEQA